MQEAVISLMQMAKTSAVLEKMRIAGIPYISVMTDPVYGGVSASLAMLGDLNIAEPGARAGFAGPNIIEQTVRQKLPSDFQKSEFLLGKTNLVLSRIDISKQNVNLAINRHIEFADHIIILAGLVGDPITKKYPELSEKINKFSISSLIDAIFDSFSKPLPVTSIKREGLSHA